MAKTVVGHLIYKITGESKEIDQSLKKAEQSVARFTKFVKSALGIGGAVLSVKALINIGKDLVTSYAEEERATAALAASIRATGGDVDRLMGQYKAFASEIQNVTTIGDEQIIGLLQQAQSFGIAEDKMQEATRGAIGLSKAFGIDMNTALRGIALAYQGNYAQLSRYIPALRTATTEAEKQAILQKAMANGFEIARSEAETATGAMLQLNNVIGDLKEQGGRAIAEFMQPAVRWLTEIVREAANAAAELNRLHELTAASQKRELTTSEQLEIVTLKIAKAEKEREAAASSMGIAVVGYTNKEIESLKQQQRALTEAMRWEETARTYRQKGEKEAAANAEAEAKRQKNLSDWIKAVNDEYAKTPEGQRAILQAEIAKWEYELTQAQKYKPEIQAILDMLYKQRDANLEIADTWKERLNAMTEETEAALANYQLRLDAELTYQIELKRIRDEWAEKKKKEEDEAKAKWKQVEQAALDFMVSIWGQIDAINSARANRELEQMRRAHDLELEGFEGTEEEKKALAEEFRKEEADLEFKAALNSWKLQLVGALAAAARAVIESMRLGFPWAIPMVALAAIQSGLQIAALRAAKPVPAYAEGVDMVVPPGYPNDSYLFHAESGERLQVTPPGKGENIISAPVIIQIDSGPIYRGMLRATQNGIALIDPKGIAKR